MKKHTTLLLLLCLPVLTFSQVYNMPGGTINTCTGLFLDPGGAANYGNNQNVTTTFCSNNGTCIRAVFSSFALENNFDYLYIYDGPSIASPLIGTYTGGTSPGTVTSSSGCLTFRFTSDGSVTAAGWQAALSCVTCPPPPPPSYNMPGGTINTCSGNFYDTGGGAGAYGNGQNITTTFCSNNGTCIQAAFSSFNIENNFDYLYVYDGPTIGSPLIGVYTGTGSPGTVASTTGCLTFRFTSDGIVTAPGWAAALSCVTCGAPPPPSTTNCSGAIAVCTDQSYNITPTGYGVQELGASNQGCLLANEHQTTWFGFSPSSVGTIELAISPTAGAVDYDFAIWGPYPPGTGCPVTGAPIRCSYSDDTAPTGMAAPNVDVSEDFTGNSWVAPLVIGAAQVGQIYYLVVDNWTANSTPFTLNWTLSPSNMLDCTPPLPVELATLNAQVSGSVNIVSWNTSSEINNSHFNVERSIDAVTYEFVGRVQGNGNSNVMNHYELTDNDPYTTTYYKLTQVDLDGASKTYGPVSVTNLEASEFTALPIYPNPTAHQFFLDMYAKELTEAEILVYNSVGQLVYSRSTSVHGSNKLEFAVDHWVPGIYIVKIMSDQSNYQNVQRLIVE